MKRVFKKVSKCFALVCYDKTYSAYLTCRVVVGSSKSFCQTSIKLLDINLTEKNTSLKHPEWATFVDITRVLCRISPFPSASAVLKLKLVVLSA